LITIHGGEFLSYRHGVNSITHLVCDYYTDAQLKAEYAKIRVNITSKAVVHNVTALWVTESISRGVRLSEGRFCPQGLSASRYGGNIGDIFGSKSGGSGNVSGSTGKVTNVITNTIKVDTNSTIAITNTKSNQQQTSSHKINVTKDAVAPSFPNPFDDDDLFRDDDDEEDHKHLNTTSKSASTAVNEEVFTMNHGVRMDTNSSSSSSSSASTGDTAVELFPSPLTPQVDELLTFLPPLTQCDPIATTTTSTTIRNTSFSNVNSNNATINEHHSSTSSNTSNKSHNHLINVNNNPPNTTTESSFCATPEDGDWAALINQYEQRGGARGSSSSSSGNSSRYISVFMIL
jgi:hypothetical protein